MEWCHANSGFSAETHFHPHAEQQQQLRIIYRRPGSWQRQWRARFLAGPLTCLMHANQGSCRQQTAPSPGSKVAEPSKGWCFVPRVYSHKHDVDSKKHPCPPARILKLKVRSSARAYYSPCSGPTVSPLAPTPALVACTGLTVFLSKERKQMPKLLIPWRKR